MIILLSPAKKLDFSGDSPGLPHSLPDFAEQSSALASLMRNKKTSDIRSLMGISPSLAELNHGRWQRWTTPSQPAADCRQAVMAFQGDVYLGMNASGLSEEELLWAQEHLRILSGLHGMLRPLDLIRPYRLEMGTRLKNPDGRDLYALWQKRLTDALKQLLQRQEEPWILNLASAEYANAVNLESLSVPVVSPVFQSHTKAGWRPVMFHAKRARGAMAAWVIRHRPKRSGLKEFAEGRFCYQKEHSTDAKPVFRLMQN